MTLKVVSRLWIKPTKPQSRHQLIGMHFALIYTIVYRIIVRGWYLFTAAWWRSHEFQPASSSACTKSVVWMSRSCWCGAGRANTGCGGRNSDVVLGRRQHRFSGREAALDGGPSRRSRRCWALRRYEHVTWNWHWQREVCNLDYNMIIIITTSRTIAWRSLHW